MKVITLAAALAVLALAGCQETQKPQAPKRAELRTVTGNTVEVIPKEGQLPYCLVFTIAEERKPPVIRQLTMIHGNRSVPCDPGKPVGGVTYRIPVEEGKIRVLVLFSDQRLNAGSIAQQIYELSDSNPRFLPMELRAPGQLIGEVIEFTPAPGDGAGAGDAVTGGTPATDGGAPTPAGGVPAAGGNAPTDTTGDAGTPSGAAATPQ